MTLQFLSSCHLPPTSTTLRLNLHTVPLMLNVKQASCEYQFLKSFVMARQGTELWSSECKADALTTTPSPLNQALQNPQASMHKYRQRKMTVLSSMVSTCFIRVKILLIKVTVIVTATVTSYFFKTVAVR